MDPDECLRLALNAYHEGNYRKADEHLKNLRQWVQGNGFMPDFNQLTTAQHRVLIGMLLNSAQCAMVVDASFPKRPDDPDTILHKVFPPDESRGPR